RNEGWGFVLHRARPRQLGSWRRALCLASFSRCRALRAAESMIKSKPLNARLSRTQQLVNHTAPGFSILARGCRSDTDDDRAVQLRFLDGHWSEIRFRLEGD